MLGSHTRDLVRSTFLPVDPLLAVPARAGVTAHSTYRMRLSSHAATVRPGGRTLTIVAFSPYDTMHRCEVDLSVLGLPVGVTAKFVRHPGGRSMLKLTAAKSSPAGTFALTVSAIVTPPTGDPAGTSAPFSLTISG